MSSTHQGARNGPPVSIIIPVFNQLEYTRMCLETLARNKHTDTHELIVVDNGSTDGTPEFLRCQQGDIRIVRNEGNLGFANASLPGWAEIDNQAVLEWVS